MRSLWNSIQITYEYPFLSLVLIFALALLVLWRFSDGHFTNAIKGLTRILADIFRAPMTSLRRTTLMCRDYDGSEATYLSSSVYLNWKLIQITSVSLLILCCIIMAGGIIGGVYSLYPSEQLAAREQINKQIERIAEERKTSEAEKAKLQENIKTNQLAAEIDKARGASAQRDKDLQKIVESLRPNSIAVEQWQAVERYIRAKYPSTAETEIVKQIDEFCASKCEAAVGASIKSATGVLIEVLELEKKATSLESQKDHAGTRLAEIDRELTRLSEMKAEFEKQRAEIQLRPTRETIVASILFVMTAITTMIGLVWLVEIGLEISRWILKAMERLEKRL